MSKNYTTWRNSKAGRGSEKRKKRRVGMRGHMRAPTPPTRREMHNRHTRDLNEKRDKRAQTNYPRPPFFLVSSYAASPLSGSLVTEMSLLYQFNPHHPVVRRQQDLVAENRVLSVVWIRIWIVHRSIVVLYGTK